MNTSIILSGITANNRSDKIIDPLVCFQWSNETICSVAYFRILIGLLQQAYQFLVKPICHDCP